MKNMTDFSAIKFDSFGSPLTPAEKAGLHEQAVKEWRMLFHDAVILGIVAIVVAGLLLLVFGNLYVAAAPIVIYILFVGSVSVAGPNLNMPRLLDLFELKRFAARNHFSYVESAANTGRPGTAFTIHKTDTTEDVISGVGFTIGRQTVRVPSPKQDRVYRLLFAELLLDRDMPHIIIDGKSCIYHLHLYYSSAQRLGLEGDFGKYYRAYCPERYETDLLYFLTPELMQSLMELKGEYDIEIIGRRLYFYTMSYLRNDNFNKPTLQKLIADVGTVVPEFLDNIKNYDHMVASKQVAGQHYGGERLKRAKIDLV